MGVYTGYFDGAISRTLSEPHVDVYECADGERAFAVIRRASNDRFSLPVRKFLRLLLRLKIARNKFPVSGEWHLQGIFGGERGRGMSECYRDMMAVLYPDDEWVIVPLKLNEGLGVERMRPKEFTRSEGERDVYKTVEASRYGALELLERAVLKKGRYFFLQGSGLQTEDEHMREFIERCKEEVMEELSDINARLSRLEAHATREGAKTNGASVSSRTGE